MAVFCKLNCLQCIITRVNRLFTERDTTKLLMQPSEACCIVCSCCICYKSFQNLVRYKLTYLTAKHLEIDSISKSFTNRVTVYAKHHACFCREKICGECIGTQLLTHTLENQVVRLTPPAQKADLQFQPYTNMVRCLSSCIAWLVQCNILQPTQSVSILPFIDRD